MEAIIKKSKTLAIIYHYHCYDGAYAAINAFLYYKNFTNGKYKLINFIPLMNIYPLFIDINQVYDKIVCLDLGIRDEDINFLNDKKNEKTSIILFDHHSYWSEKYNNEYKEKLKDRKKLKIFYDDKNTRSACGMTFDYYKKKAISKKDIDKKMVEEIFNNNLKAINDYIEDSDTGHFKIKDIHEFKSALSSNYPLNITTDFSYKTYQRINTFLKVDLSYLIKIGKKCLERIKKQTKKILKKNWIYIVELKGGYKFLMCITEEKYVRNYACPLLAKISEKKGYLPVGAFVFSYTDTLYKFSMRTYDDLYDVSKLAKIYGGGGHKAAAAFEMDYDGIDNLIVDTIDIYKDIEEANI
jgi:nanoRNase/pAp phosphatase (c-di-AMP/oligoRNAs hydrolase)